MWSRGALDANGVREVLVRIAGQTGTGTLTVQGREDVLAVRFRTGEIVGADALRESFSEGLGRILVEQELMSPAKVTEVGSAELHSSIVDHLTTSGQVDPEQLSRCVREHSFRLLCDLLGWTSGEYQFYEGEVSWNRAVEPLSVEELLVRASERNSRLTGGPVAEFGEVVLRPVLTGRSYSVLSWDETGGREVEGSLWITPLEDAVLKSLDGLTPACEFSEILGIDEFRLRFSLHRLLGAGLVEPVLAPEPEDEPEPASSLDPSVAAGAATVPDPLHAPRPGVRPDGLVELRALLSDLSQGFSLVLAAGLALLLLSSMIVGAGSPLVHHPLPWQVAERNALQRLRGVAGYRNLSARLGRHHILYGTFPNELPLPGSVLLSDPLSGLSGQELVYEVFDNGYSVELKPEGSSESQLFRFGSAGDFLLDPDFTRVESTAGSRPIVLVD